MCANSLEIIDYSLKKFSELTNEDKVLLNNGFNIILEAKMPTHSIYFDPDIPKVLTGNLNYRPNQYCTDNPPRSPYEIISITTGNKVEELQVIYFPDEVKGTAIEKIVRAHAYSLGFRGKFKYYSELNVLQHDSCVDRYKSFTWSDLKEMIKVGVLKKDF